MADRIHARRLGSCGTQYRCPDPDLVDLVDALVEAVDTDRTREVDQLRFALEPFGGTALFDAELRLNGTPSTDHCPCQAEGWL